MHSEACANLTNERMLNVDKQANEIRTEENRFSKMKRKKINKSEDIGTLINGVENDFFECRSPRFDPR